MFEAGFWKQVSDLADAAELADVRPALPEFDVAERPGRRIDIELLRTGVEKSFYAIAEKVAKEDSFRTITFSRLDHFMTIMCLGRIGVF